MDVIEYPAILRKRWISVASVAVATLVCAGALTLLATAQYQATTRLFFAVPGGDSVTDLAQGSSFAEKQMGSYVEVATSPLVLDKVIASLELDISSSELSSKVRASVPANTVILEITASYPDAEKSAQIANAVGAGLAEAVAGLYPQRADGTQAVLATTMSSATTPDAPASPNLRRNLALALVLGTLLGAATAVVIESLDTKIRTSRDLTGVSEKAQLGIVAFDPEAASHPIIMVDRPGSVRAEEIRRLRTNLQFVNRTDRPRSILVTSSVATEGKTTTAVNLAVAMGDGGARVVLVDADLRRPSLQDVMGLEGSAGLTSLLIGRAAPVDVIQPWLHGRLDVITSGPIPPNPSELLGSPAMANLLGELKKDYDVVLIDSPPLVPVTDAAVLSTMVDGTLLVVGADRATKTDVRSAIDSLEAVDSQLMGLVLNKVAARETGSYSGNYVYADKAAQTGRS